MFKLSSLYQFFGLGQTSALSDLMLAGEKFCGEDWLNLKGKYHNSGDEDISRYCFSSAYIVALLHDSLGVPLNDRRYFLTFFWIFLKDDCIKMLFLFERLLSIESFMVWACHHRSPLKLLILQLKLQGGFYPKSYCRFLGGHYSSDILHNLHLGQISFHLLIYYLSNK